MSSFYYRLITPKGIVEESECSSLEFPTAKGIIQVLPGHCEMVGLLGIGPVNSSIENSKLVVVNGVFKIDNLGVTLLADYALKSDSEEFTKLKESLPDNEKRLAELNQLGSFDAEYKDLSSKIAIARSV